MILFVSSLCPLFGAILLFLRNDENSRRMPWIVSSVCMLASFIMIFSQFNLFSILHSSITDKESYLPLFSINFLQTAILLKINSLSPVFLGTISLVMFFIGFFSFSYSRTKPNTGNLMAKLLLTTFLLMNLCLSGNLFTFFVFMFLLSLANYVSLDFYRQRYKTNQASFTALAFNFFADIFILIASLNLIAFGQLSHYILQSEIIIILALLIKSGQMPFGLWVTETMYAPSPTGAFLNSLSIPITSFFIYTLFYPVLNAYTLNNILYFIIIISILASAISSCLQTEIKKILNQNTICMTGFILLALLNNQINIALIIFVIHAIAKTSLYLNYAVIIQQTSGEHDIRQIGGLGSLLKTSRLTSVINTLALVIISTFMITIPNTSYHIFILILSFTIPFFISFSLFRPLIYIFFGPVFGDDAIISRISSEKISTKLSIIIPSLISVITLLSIIIFSPDFLNVLYIISAFIGLLFVVGFFNHNFSFSKYLEDNFTNTSHLIKQNFGSTIFYQNFLPTLAKNEGAKISGQIQNLINRIMNIFWILINFLSSHISSPQPTNFSKNTIAVLFGIIFIILITLLFKEYT